LFEILVLGIIVLSALLIGAKAYPLPSFVSRVLPFLDWAITLFFLAEITEELWGDIAISMLTLFRVMTFEDWIDVMYESMAVYPLSLPCKSCARKLRPWMRCCGSACPQPDRRLPARKGLDVEAEVDDVAVLHYVILAFQAPAPGVLGTLFAIVGDEIVVADDLSADEAFLEVGVNHRRRFRGCGADFDCPGTHFLYASCEVGLQV
jgi:hypothetical protein